MSHHVLVYSTKRKNAVKQFIIGSLIEEAWSVAASPVALVFVKLLLCGVELPARRTFHDLGSLPLFIASVRL